MAPKRRSTVVAAVPLAAEIPFSPGNGHSVEEYTARYVSLHARACKHISMHSVV